MYSTQKTDSFYVLPKILQPYSGPTYTDVQQLKTWMTRVLENSWFFCVKPPLFIANPRWSVWFMTKPALLPQIDLASKSFLLSCHLFDPRFSSISLIAQQRHSKCFPHKSRRINISQAEYLFSSPDHLNFEKVRKWARRTRHLPICSRCNMFIEKNYFRSKNLPEDLIFSPLSNSLLPLLQK